MGFPGVLGVEETGAGGLGKAGMGAQDVPVKEKERFGDWERWDGQEAECRGVLVANKGGTGVPMPRNGSSRKGGCRYWKRTDGGTRGSLCPGKEGYRSPHGQGRGAHMVGRHGIAGNGGPGGPRC